MKSSRRGALALIGGTLASTLASRSSAAPPADPERSRLHLLGTGGGPSVGGERAMACNAIAVGDRIYVIDCGYGAAGLLAKAGISLRQTGAIFITHNHADHMLDLGPLLFLCWLQGRTAPIALHGPPPLAHITQCLLAANTASLDYYRTDMAMPGMPPVEVREHAVTGAVFDDGIVKVRSAIVAHPPVAPALAYRFDLPDRSIVFSGDTAPNDALVTLAKGADLLVHEACLVPAMLAMMAGTGSARADGAAQPQGFDAQRFRAHVLQAHSAAEDAGRVAAAAGVRTLVLNHLAPGSSRLAPDGDWLAAARRSFAGEIVVAHDGMTL